MVMRRYELFICSLELFAMISVLMMQFFQLNDEGATTFSSPRTVRTVRRAGAITGEWTANGKCRKQQRNSTWEFVSQLKMRGQAEKMPNSMISAIFWLGNDPCTLKRNCSPGSIPPRKEISGIIRSIAGEKFNLGICLPACYSLQFLSEMRRIGANNSTTSKFWLENSLWALNKKDARRSTPAIYEIAAQYRFILWRKPSI